MASRAAGAPPARGTRGAVGGTGHIVTRNRQDPFSEFNNFVLLQSQGNGGLDKGGEGQENISQRNKYLGALSLDIEPDWQKTILIINRFCPTTKAVRLFRGNLPIFQILEF